MNTAGKHPFRHLVCLCVPLFLIGCASLPGSEESPPDETVVNARQQIAQSREKTQLLIQRIKQKYKGRETQAAYIRARDLYDEAMVQHNSWVTSLKLGIANNENLEMSRAFRDKAKSAGDATTAFLDYGYALTHSGAETKSLTLQTVGEIIKILVENGVVIWKAYRAEESADRLAAAERTEKELKWSSWEIIK